jgi:hemoglobin/transferrin/lactoferrin receptor protein
MKRRTCWWCMILLVCTFRLTASGQSHLLKGRVIDGTLRKGVSDATVTLVETMQKTMTEENGSFSIDRVVPGRYTLRIHHLAYGTLERAVFTLSAPESLLIVLEPAMFQADEVVVHSTRTPSIASTTPYPMDIELHDAIAGIPVVTIADALQSVPGLALVRDGAWETAIAIRGLSRSNIVTVVDNARIETSNDIAGALSLIDLHDLERVEVLKSPSSTQQGSGAVGGVVHMVSKRPAFADAFRVHGEVISDLSSVDGGVSQHGALEASDSRLAMRVSGRIRNAGDTQTPEGVLAGSEYHDYSFSSSLGVRIGEAQTALASYQRVQATDTGIPGGAPFGATSTAKYTRAVRELFGLEYRVPNPTDVLSLLTFRAQRQEIQRNVEVKTPDLTTLTPHAVHTTTGVSVDASLAPSADLIFTTGIEAWQRELDSRRERRSAVGITGERPLPHSRYLSAGAFVHGEWAIVPDRITATCGARYDRIRVSNDEARNPEYVIINGVTNLAPPNQRLLWTGATEYDGSWSAHAGVRYAVTPVLGLTALVAASFRSPSLEERYEFIDLGSVVYVGNPELNAERSYSVNAGFRLQTDVLRVRSDVFLNAMSNMVSQMPGVFEGRSAYFRENVGRARLYGFEIEAEQTVTQWCAAEATAAYVRGEDLYNNTNLPQVPPLSGHIALKGVVDGVGTTTLEVPWAASQGNPGPGESATPGYATLNVTFSSLAMTFASIELTLGAGVRNIFNTPYKNHLSTLRGIVRCEPGRNAVLSVSLTF